MLVYLQDRFVPEQEATVSVFDRGFLYGDGLFETIRVHAGRPFLWSAHLQRLELGARSLGLDLPASAEALLATALELLARNQLEDAILRIAVSRGRGERGYSPRGANHPTLVVTTHPTLPLADLPPPPSRLHTSIHRVPAGDPLGSIKTASKLLNILARAEAEAAGADEALLLNTRGEIAEAASANVFWFDGHQLFTPHLDAGAVAGVTRGFVLRQLAPDLGWPAREISAPPDALLRASGAFLAFSGQGVVEISALDGQALARDPRTARLRAAFLSAVREDCQLPGLTPWGQSR